MDTKQKEVILDTAKQQQRPEEKIVETKQLVTFELDKEEYAAPILDLKEILKTPEIVSVPGTHPAIKGIFNLRGRIAIVIDLEKRFALLREHPTEPRHVVIVEIEDALFGISVDEVTGVMRVPVNVIKPAPSLITSKIHADYITGVVVLEGPATPETEKEKTPTAKTKENEKKQQTKEQKSRSRLLLLLDLPKMLSEKELLNFGAKVNGVTKETTKK